jgi:alpha-beta hydrolase superfamily lysophospholipase
MSKIKLNLINKIIQRLLYLLMGGFISLFTVAVIYLNQQPELKVWHTVKLDAEFSVSTPVRNFADYLALEERLFAQLKERVYKQVKPEDQLSINRYHHDSVSDPERWSPNWNRSFELSVKEPVAGVLLLHGMSDSPYSLHNLGARLHTEGAHVVGLRIPGHGTAPSGLVEVRWQDMAAAVELAVKHLHEQVGDRPIYIVGYSNGGALALYYALSVIEDPTLPPVKKLVLISPEIGVTKMAALAIWQERIGHWLGLKNLVWNSVLMEYDPFKYNSFAVNAGNQAYLLTNENRLRLNTMAEAGKLDQFPSILAFQSVLDATVSVSALVNELFEQLPDRSHELVLFDVNRIDVVEYMLKLDPNKHIKALSENPTNRFVLSLVTNRNNKSNQMIVRTWKPGHDVPSQTDINLTWPKKIFSLGHIALPFPEQDPLYGAGQQKDSPGIQLGNFAMWGETGMIQIPASDMLRIHWNPFYPYLEQRILEHIIH